LEGSAAVLIGHVVHLAGLAVYGVAVDHGAVAGDACGDDDVPQLGDAGADGDVLEIQISANRQRAADVALSE